jgi:hypothetical protein
MANTLLTPQIIAREALMVLRNNAVMSNLVYRDYSSEFAAVGDTITVRKPATFEANEFDASKGITVQSATENSVSVKMDKLLDVSFEVTTKELSLEIEDFSNQLLVPAMQAFSDKIDSYLIGLEKELTNRVAHASGAIAPADLIDARKFLVDNAAPTTNRNFVIGSQAEADLLKSDLFVNYSAVGETAALKEASLGRKFGMDIYTDQNIKKVSATSEYTPSIAFHKNAFALVTRTPQTPLGAASAYVENYDGYGLRVVYAYDANKKVDTISIDMLCGVKLLDDRLASVVVDTRA